VSHSDGFTGASASVIEKENQSVVALP
jgi:hypothetical protein